jgi:hypothetical protein
LELWKPTYWIFAKYPYNKIKERSCEAIKKWMTAFPNISSFEGG